MLRYVYNHSKVKRIMPSVCFYIYISLYMSEGKYLDLKKKRIPLGHIGINPTEDVNYVIANVFGNGNKS